MYIQSTQKIISVDAKYNMRKREELQFYHPKKAMANLRTMSAHSANRYTRSDVCLIVQRGIQWWRYYACSLSNNDERTIVTKPKIIINRLHMDVMFEIFNHIFVDSFISLRSLSRFSLPSLFFPDFSWVFLHLHYLDVTYMFIAHFDNLWSLAWVDAVDGFQWFRCSSWIATISSSIWMDGYEECGQCEYLDVCVCACLNGLSDWETFR